MTDFDDATAAHNNMTADAAASWDFTHLWRDESLRDQRLRQSG